MKEEQQPVFQVNVESEKDLNKLDLSNLDTSNVKGDKEVLEDVFKSDVGLRELDLSNFGSSFEAQEQNLLSELSEEIKEAGLSKIPAKRGRSNLWKRMWY